LRQEPILGGEAVGPPLKSLAAGLGRQSFGSLFAGFMASAKTAGGGRRPSAFAFVGD
jgi:hypothetical protein